MNTTHADPKDPFGTLMTLVISLLAPMFLGVTGGNIPLARAAALETINAYRAHNSVGLLAVVQIIAFGLAAIGSLSLSLDDNVPVKMALRLRGNANACDRSAERNRRALQAAQLLQKTQEAEENEAFFDTIFAEPEPAEPAKEPPMEPKAFLTPDAERLLAAEAEARLQNNPIGHAPKTPAKPASNQQAWAQAMQREADKITANLPNLKPAERQHAMMQADTLRTTAKGILAAGAAAALKKTG
jgi:hypothetical protein